MEIKVTILDDITIVVSKDPCDEETIWVDPSLTGVTRNYLGKRAYDRKFLVTTTKPKKGKFRELVKGKATGMGHLYNEEGKKDNGVYICSYRQMDIFGCVVDRLYFKKIVKQKKAREQSTIFVS